MAKSVEFEQLSLDLRDSFPGFPTNIILATIRSLAGIEAEVKPVKLLASPEWIEENSLNLEVNPFSPAVYGELRRGIKASKIPLSVTDDGF